MLIEHVTPEMEANTQAKFDAWDEAVEGNWLSGNVEQQRKAVKLLQDVTIYMYAFFKNPNDTSKPLKLYPYQDLVVNDNHRKVLLISANQVGKSLALCCRALHFALNNPGTTRLMFSKTLPQSKDLLRQIRALLRTCTIDYEHTIGESYNKTEIYLKHYDVIIENGKKIKKELLDSRIICLPASESALGYAAHEEDLDEVAFYENGRHFYYQIALPRTYTTKGRICMVTNPNGQIGIAWDIWDKKNNFHKYRFNFLDCPTNTQEEYDALKLSMPRHQFDSTVNAIFTDPEGGFITLSERKDMQDENIPNRLPSLVTAPLYIFYDFAKIHDRTVRIIGIPINANKDDWAPEVQVKEMKEYSEGVGYDIVVNDLKELVQSYGNQRIAMIGWDNTGVGSGINDFIKRVRQLGISAVPVEFSLQNKSRIYTLFKLLVEQRRIKMPFVEECDNQLASLRFRTSTRGYLQVHHENEKDRDDFPDALAGLCSLIIQPEYVPVTVTIVGGEDKVKEIDGFHGFIES